MPSQVGFRPHVSNEHTCRQCHTYNWGSPSTGSRDDCTPLAFSCPDVETCTLPSACTCPGTCIFSGDRLAFSHFWGASGALCSTLEHWDAVRRLPRQNSSSRWLSFCSRCRFHVWASEYRTFLSDPAPVKKRTTV